MKDYFEDVWMPQTILLGISYWDFWDLNPRIISILVKAYNKTVVNDIRKQNMLMHLNGRYMADALLSTVGNMFRNKGTPVYEYPKEPYTLDLKDEDKIVTTSEEDREIELKRKQFVTSLNNLFRDIDTTLKEKNNAND